MATIYPDDSNPYSQDPLFQALSKQKGGVATQEISHDGYGITYALKWAEGMKQALIIPKCHRIQRFLQEMKWIVTYQTYNSLMMATFTMSLPDGVYTYPEKHMEDWEAAFGKINGANINLGILPAGDIVVPSKHDGKVFAVQWPHDTSNHLIIPNCSVIQRYLEEIGWIVTCKNFEAAMLAIFSLSLPRGVHTYPEKASEDWKLAVKEVNGAIDLGTVTGKYYADQPDGRT